jgi:3-dehydroquinate synthase
MRHDKKVEDGKLRLVLLEKIGKAVISDAASEREILASINAACT